MFQLGLGKIHNILKGPDPNARCNYCKKTRHYKKACRGKRGTSKGWVGLLHGKARLVAQLAEDDDVSSQQDNWVRWVNDHQSQPTAGTRTVPRFTSSCQFEKIGKSKS